MKKIFSEEEIKKIKAIKGEIRGLALKNYAQYIVREHGKEGLERLEEVTSGIGLQIKYSSLNTMSFYPLKLSAATFAVLARMFQYDEKKFYEMGRFCFKFPNIIRMWAQYLISMERAVKSAPKMHRMYFTVGDLSIPEHSNEKKYLKIRLKNFPFFPLDLPQGYCFYLTGYYSSIMQVIVGKESFGEVIKCSHQDEEYNEFLVKW